jgi:hypothetical protein
MLRGHYRSTNRCAIFLTALPIIATTACSSAKDVDTSAVETTATTTDRLVSDSSEVPPDYVATPGGRYHHKDCIHELEKGAVADEEGNVRRADGTTYAVPRCSHAAYRVQKKSGEQPPTIGGWYEAGTKYNAGGYTEFDADWYVPSNPSTGGGLLYFFSGLEPDDYTRILQPVLQWGFTGDSWTLASWSCAQNSCYHSALQATSPGNHIYGWMTGSSCNGGICYWQISTYDATTGAFTALDWQAHVAYTRAYAALEAYRIDTCGQLSLSGGLGMSTSIWRWDGTYASAGWGASYWPISPNCGQYVAGGYAGWVGLYWNP